MTITQAAQALRERRLSSRELTDECLNRIAAMNPVLNAFITVTEASARERAAAMDQEMAQGKYRGPLHGIPIALKDVFETKGIRTTCGSVLFHDNVPARDAAVVEKLDAAGCVLLGKTGMHELAYGITSNNPHFGPVRNPCDTQRIPGGSSGGSGAAVAAELAFMAMGTDTGGSIRIPASFCGTVGLKPTYGRVSRYGVMPLDFSLDHMGPLTRSVRDAAVTLDAIAGHDPRDPTASRRGVTPYAPPETAAIQGLRIGVPKNFYFDRVDCEITSLVFAMVDTAASLGATITEVHVPDITELNAVSRVILLVEASAVMEQHAIHRDKFGADVMALLDQGRLIPGTDYVNAQRLRRLMQEQFRAIFRQVDCLFSPTTPTTAPRIGQTAIEIGGETDDVRLASTRLVRGFNMLGLPALAMPCGLVKSGLPASLQIVGRPFEEDLILRVGAALEDARR